MAGRDSHFGDVDHAALEALLQAPSKEKVNEIFLLAFRARHGATDAQLDKVVEKLGGNSTRVRYIIALRIPSKPRQPFDSPGIRFRLIGPP